MDDSVSRLTVYGWTDEARVALEALEATGAFRGVAVADPSAAALVRARRESGLACHQQVGEWLRHGEFEAVLLGGGMAASYAGTAAARGISLIVLGDEASAADLREASRQAAMHDVPLTVLRPTRHGAGLSDLARLVAGQGAPAYLDITIEAPTDALRLLTVGVAHLIALTGHIDGTAHGSAWGDAPRVLAATIESGRHHASIRARHAPDMFVRIAGDGPTGAFELRIEQGTGYLAMTGADSDHLRYEVEASDHWRAEAQRAARIATSDALDDRDEAASIGSLLDTIARAIASGAAQDTECCRRPVLRIIGGGGRTRERVGNLHLVVS